MFQNIKTKFLDARGAHAKKKYEYYKQLNEKYNFQIPNFIKFGQGDSDGENVTSEYIASKEKFINETDISNLRIYIGRIEKNGKGRPYGKKFLIELMTFMASNTKEYQDINIYMCNFLGEYLNNNVDKDYYTREEQKKYLQKLFKDNIGKERLNNLKIIDLANRDEHKKLAETLEKSKTEGLYSGKEEPFSIESTEDITSLDILNYLKWLSSINKDFFELLKSPKPANDNTNDYYSMIEMSFRIHDLLHGQTFQGGSNQQTKTDRIISFLINPDIPKISIKSANSNIEFDSSGFNELEKFRKFCKTKLEDKKFSWLHFNADECGKFYKLKKTREEEPINTTKKLILKYKNHILGIIIGAISTATVGTGYLYYQKNKEEQKLSSTIAEAVKKKSMTITLDSPYLRKDIENTEEKVLQVNQIAKLTLNDFIIRYGLVDKDKQELVYKLLLSQIPEDEIMHLSSIGETDCHIINLTDRFVEKHKIFLVANNINIIPYEHLKHLEEDFIRTINYLSGINNPGNVSEKQFNKSIKMISNVFVRKHDYTLVNGKTLGISFLYKTNIEPRDKKDPLYYILPLLANEDIICVSENGEVKIGVKLAYDYFFQTRPDIKKIFTTLKFGGLHEMLNNINEYDFIEKLLIKDYINNEEKIKDIINKKGIPFYINTEFYTKYKKIIKQKGIEFKRHYFYLEENLDAIRNSFNYKGKSMYFTRKQIKYIGNFISKDSEQYQIGIIDINNKKYMVYSHYSDKEWVFHLNNYNTHLIIKEILDQLKLTE